MLRAPVRRQSAPPPFPIPVKTFLILAFGALLIGGLYALRSRNHDSMSVSVAAPVRTVTGRTNSGLVGPNAAADVPEAVLSPWAALEGGDFATFVARLRAAGCPEETVRVFTIAALGRHYQERVSKPARERAKNTPWWREPNATFFDFRREQAAQKTARAEFQEQLTGLLGASGASALAEFSPFSLGTKPAWMTEEQHAALSRTKDRFQNAVDDIVEKVPHGASSPILTEEQRESLRQLRQRELAEIRALLGPAAFARYEAEQSSESRYAKNSLPEAKSEADFLLMVQAAKEVGVEDFDQQEDRFWRTPGLGVPGEPQPPSLRDRVLARYQELAGSERSAELEVQLALEEIQAEESHARRREIDEVNDLRALAVAGGVEVADDEIRAFKAALEAKGKELDATLGPLSNVAAEDQATVEAYILSEMEKVATAAFGSRGRVIVEQMKKRIEADKK